MADHTPGHCATLSVCRSTSVPRVHGRAKSTAGPDASAATLGAQENGASGIPTKHGNSSTGWTRRPERSAGNNTMHDGAGDIAQNAQRRLGSIGLNGFYQVMPPGNNSSLSTSAPAVVATTAVLA